MAGTQEREIYVVCGMGRDVTGLVSLVTSIISDASGNIIDMEEGVFHGLFSIFLTVDLTGAAIPGPQFVAKLQAVAHQSGLQIIAERQRFTPRHTTRRMMRLLLVGVDQSGIVSRATYILANNGVNVESARMISRGDLFAMEMELDASASTRSTAAIEKGVGAEMERAGIRSLFQTEEIYRKHPRLLVFTATRNLLDDEMRAALLEMAGNEKGRTPGMEGMAGLKLETVKALAASTRLTSEADDLLHSLKLMGYVIMIVSSGFEPFLNALRGHPAIDHLRCNALRAEKGKLTGAVEQLTAPPAKALIAEVARGDQIAGDKIIIISDSPPADVTLGDLGIRLTLDAGAVRTLIKKGSIAASQIRSIIAAFGPP
ncbi:MAG: hypothetical protein NT045_08690 [Candidatus Aureabacteria bacterium]|nr:hypothetical protein [Candidatus Auribacterota bacterium]